MPAMSLETVVLEHVPSSHRVHLALFRNVRNAGFLHQQLLARNSDFEYAFIDASMIVSRIHLLSAVFKAVNNSVSGILKTPNVHSETVVSLSSSSNIADAYRRFGVSPSTTDLFVVKITFPSDSNPVPASPATISQHLRDNVQGDVVPATDDSIAAITDVRTVRKNYKLNGLAWLDAIKDELVKREEVERLVLGGMALRGL
ncbi:kinase binding protein CGI-121 domain-containing protein [Trichoderma ceciliae]